MRVSRQLLCQNAVVLVIGASRGIAMMMLAALALPHAHARPPRTRWLLAGTAARS